MIVYSKSKFIQCPTPEAGSRLRLNHGAIDSYGQRRHQTTRNRQHQRHVDDRKSSEVISLFGTPPQQLATTTANETPRYFNGDAPLFQRRRPAISTKTPHKGAPSPTHPLRAKLFSLTT